MLPFHGIVVPLSGNKVNMCKMMNIFMVHLNKEINQNDTEIDQFISLKKHGYHSTGLSSVSRLSFYIDSESQTT